MMFTSLIPLKNKDISRFYKDIVHKAKILQNIIHICTFFSTKAIILVTV